MSGKTAVEQMIAGVTDKMVGFECDRTNGYTCKAKLFNLSDVANFEKKFPREWINAEGNNVTEDVRQVLPCPSFRARRSSRRSTACPGSQI